MDDLNPNDDRIDELLALSVLGEITAAEEAETWAKAKGMLKATASGLVSKSDSPTSTL